MQILFLLIGIALGGALGWFAAKSNSPAKNAEHPAPTPTPTPAAPELAAVKETLGELSSRLHTMDRDRASAYSALASQVQAITRTSIMLGDRTEKLLQALKSPQTRGRWGEIQLERVVELGGMVKHCDFDTQVSRTKEGATVRPDMVIHLSGGRQIIVDAKVPFSSYLDALETPDPEEHAGYLRRHAHQLRAHVMALSTKDYISAFDPSPEFVVLFVPADPFLDAALEVDPELLEYAFSRDIVIATPTTLFALLRTVALGWRHDDLDNKARRVQELGAELYTRLNTMATHYDRVGKQLGKTVEAYNATLGTMDSRVMVTARRLAEIDMPTAPTRRPVEVDPVDASPRRPLALDSEELSWETWQ